MDRSLHAYTESIVQRDDVQSVLLMDKQERYNPFMDGADLLYVVVVNRPEPRWETKHFTYRDYQVVEHCISQWQLERWATYGASERIVCWMTRSMIVFDRDDYVKGIRERLTRLPLSLQKRRLCEEYSRLLKAYLDARELLLHQHALDAYQILLHALNVWARLAVWEAGELPEAPIWKQVKQIDPAVHKLYEELIASNEPLEKRIELLLLAIEFSLMSKMKACTLLLADILQSQHRPWSIEELRQHPDLAGAEIDLPLLLDKMTKRSLIQEIVLHQEGEVVWKKGYILTG